MKRASSILESTRLDRELNFDEIAKKTKIPVKYLIAIENEQTENFPSEPYCSLIVKDYADFLGLNGEDLLSIFRRDYDRKINVLPPRRFIFALTPQTAFTLFLYFIALVFFVYLAFEYFKFNRPPSLKVTWPENITDNTIEISGDTDSESTIKINDSLVIVDSDGHFKKNIEISTSEAKIVVEAKSPAGKTTRDEKVLK